MNECLKTHNKDLYIEGINFCVSCGAKLVSEWKPSAREMLGELLALDGNVQLQERLLRVLARKEYLNPKAQERLRVSEWLIANGYLARVAGNFGTSIRISLTRKATELLKAQYKQINAIINGEFSF